MTRSTRAWFWLILAVALVFGGLRLPGGSVAGVVALSLGGLFLALVIAPAKGIEHGSRRARWLAATDRRNRRRLGLLGAPETPADLRARQAPAVWRGLLVAAAWAILGIGLLAAAFVTFALALNGLF